MTGQCMQRLTIDCRCRSASLASSARVITAVAVVVEYLAIPVRLLTGLRFDSALLGCFVGRLWAGQLRGSITYLESLRINSGNCWPDSRSPFPPAFADYTTC